MIECPQHAGGISKGEVEVLRALRSRKRWAAATVGVAVIGTLAAAVAVGSPGSGVAITTLVTANFDNTVHLNSDRVKFQTKGATDVRMQKLVFGPGGKSGYGPDSPNGAVFAEGGDSPQQVTTAGGATVYATFVAPSADPPVTRIEDDAVSCP